MIKEDLRTCCPSQKLRTPCRKITYGLTGLKAWLRSTRRCTLFRRHGMSVFHMIMVWFRGLVRDRTDLATENLALRQQLAVLTVRKRRPRLRRRDRFIWVWLSRLRAGWRSVLMIVQPDTVVQWHRQGFRLYWRWKS